MAFLRSSLMVFGSFVLFVPSFMSQVFGLDPVSSSNVASLYSAGCLTSLLFSSSKFSNLSKQGKKIALRITLSIGAIASLLTYFLTYFQTTSKFGFHTSPLVPALPALCMFLWGLSFPLAFYFPPTVYALRSGGKVAAATVTDSLDFFAFGALAGFNRWVAGVDGREGWGDVLLVCTALVLSSIGVLPDGG